jgi:hypothetical protein
MSHFIYPSDFIYWTKSKNHESNKKELIQNIIPNLDVTKDQHKNKWRCDLNTEFFNISEESVLKYRNLIINDIYPALDKMFEELPLVPPKTSEITSIWYNYYKDNQFQEVHNHVQEYKRPNISGIYLLKLEEENQTIFYSYQSSLNGFVNPVRQIKAVEGDILLFPSHLLHYVAPCSKERITIAFNIKCDNQC